MQRSGRQNKQSLKNEKEGKRKAKQAVFRKETENDSLRLITSHSKRKGGSKAEGKTQTKYTNTQTKRTHKRITNTQIKQTTYERKLHKQTKQTKPNQTVEFIEHHHITV